MKVAVKILLSIALAGCLLNAASASPVEQRYFDDWLYVGAANGSNYYRHENIRQTTWFGARQICLEAGMELATISTIEQYLVVSNGTLGQGVFWTAARDANSHIQFLWDNSPDHPDSSIVQNYTHMGQYTCCLSISSGQFHENWCIENYRTICQTRNASLVPSSNIHVAHVTSLQTHVKSSRRDTLMQPDGPRPLNLSLIYLGSADGKSFYLDTVMTRNWFESKELCESVGMKLFSVRTEAQNALLTEASANATTLWWTAGHDSQWFSQYVWDTNGEAPMIGNLHVMKGFYETCLLYNKNHYYSSSCRTYLAHAVCEDENNKVI